MNGNTNDGRPDRPELPREEEEGQSVPYGYSSGLIRRASQFDWRQQIGISGEDRPWLDSFGSEDPSPGGIASRLLNSKVELLAETKARYHIVLKRKEEYEGRISRLEDEIQEIRSLIEELLNFDSEE